MFDIMKQTIHYSLIKTHTKINNMESIINTRIPEFKVQAYHNGEFKTITDKDVLGKWAIFFLLSCRLHIRMPNRT